MHATLFLKRLTVLSLLISGLFSHRLHSAPVPYINYEGKQTSPARLSADGTRLFVVNTPDARLSVFDVSLPSNPVLIAEIPVGIEPVSVNPRTADEVWVVNEVSDSVSIVSLSQHAVTDTLYVPDEPADVVFAGGRAFVTSGRKNQVVVFDAATREPLATIPLFGQNPRAIATSMDGTKVYAAFALSGNRTTLILPANAPNQPAPSNTSLPNPPKVGLIVDAIDPSWSSIVKYKVADNDVVEIDVAALTITRYFTNVGTINLGFAVRPDNGDLYVANTDARNLIQFEPNLRSHVVENRVTRINITTGARTFYDLNPGVDYNTLPNPTALATALAQPTAIAFDPSGNYFYVAAFGTDRVARIDKDGNILNRIEISDAAGDTADPRHKRGPRGLALNAAAQRLYVVNRISNTLTLVDTDANSVLKEIPIGSHDPTPEVIRRGRGFLYDAKLSGNGNASCATCHVDSEMDLLAWDLGDPAGTLRSIRVQGTNPPVAIINVPAHPMKGPLMTQTFRGLQGNEPFHWRADRTNFVEFRTTFDTLLGGPTLSELDMTAFKDFIETVITQPNPNQNLNRTYSTNIAGGNAIEGLLDFQRINAPCGKCDFCHDPRPGPGTTNKVFLGSMAGVENQPFKLPHMRNLYQKLGLDKREGAESLAGFGFLHDGREENLITFLSREFFDHRIADTAKTNLAAFMLSFDNGTAPAVGHSFTIHSLNADKPAITDTLALLMAQANALTNIDLIAKGTFDGKRHGLHYEPATQTFRLDTAATAPLTQSELMAKIQAGGRLTFTGVPPGSGRRMGIDRDLDGVLDGDVPPPSLQGEPAGAGLVLRWPFNAVGFALETATSLTPGVTWTNFAAPLQIIGSQNVLTNSTTNEARFFRLRSP